MKFGDILCFILFYSNPNCAENEATAFRWDTHSITIHEKDLGSESASSQLLLGASSQIHNRREWSTAFEIIAQ